MHLIVDIRSFTNDPMIARYASSWVELWWTRHPEHRISYIHFSHQICPLNGESIVVNPPNWLRRVKRLSTKNTSEIFRCINFSGLLPYDSHIETISHIFDHADILYPRIESSGIQKLLKIHKKNTSYKIIVPSLSVGQESVSITHTKEENIEIIPYLQIKPVTIHKNILTQFSIVWSYWIYDGSYGSEANIPGLLSGYKAYRDLGWTHTLILMWQSIDMELKNISEEIQKMNLTGFVRIIGTLDIASVESLYASASGWIYIGAYYASGPRIELAQSYNIPLLISNIPSLQEYHNSAITTHPNHLSALGNMFQELETFSSSNKRKVSNTEIIRAYEKIIAERS